MTTLSSHAPLGSKPSYSQLLSTKNEALVENKLEPVDWSKPNANAETKPVHDSRDLWQSFHLPVSESSDASNYFVDQFGINPYACGVFGLGIALVLFVLSKVSNMGSSTKNEGGKLSQHNFHRNN